jgi:hypothetical protein
MRSLCCQKPPYVQVPNQRKRFGRAREEAESSKLMFRESEVRMRAWEGRPRAREPLISEARESLS